jgi:hypothetical protein
LKWLSFGPKRQQRFGASKNLPMDAEGAPAQTRTALRLKLRRMNAEGVGQFQPRVFNPGNHRDFLATLKAFARLARPVANAFSVCAISLVATQG